MFYGFARLASLPAIRRRFLFALFVCTVKSHDLESHHDDVDDAGKAAYIENPTEFQRHFYAE